MRRLAGATAVLCALCAATATGASGQTVADIVEAMYAAAERESEGVDDYILVQRALGFETTSYFEKDFVEGHPVFRLKDSDTEGFSFGLGEEGAGVGDVFLYGPKLVEHGRYEGRGEVAGSAVHVLVVDDVSGMGIVPPSAPGGIEFRPRTLRLHVDDAMMVPRRLEFTGDALTPSGPRAIAISVEMQAFLPVGTLFVPYRTVVRIDGLRELMGPETMAQVEEAQRRLEAMPQDERDAMSAVLGPQLEMLRQMASGGDAMSVVITIGDVFINTGGVR